MGVLMHFSAYSLATIQNAAALVRTARDNGITLEELATLLAEHVDCHTSPGEIVQTRSQLDPCPTEGCPGRLEPWPISSGVAGVQVVGCLLCRYSRIDGLNDGR